MVSFDYLCRFSELRCRKLFLRLYRVVLGGTFPGTPLFFMFSNTSLKNFELILYGFGVALLQYSLSRFGSPFVSLLYF